MKADLDVITASARKVSNGREGELETGWQDLLAQHGAAGVRSSQIVENVKIASLVRGESPRSGGEDKAHLQHLMEAEWPLPPIVVHRDTMQIIDGFHRVSAASAKGFEEIQAVFVDLPWEFAFAVAVRANVTHGLPLASSDRRAAAARILQLRSDLSDRTIAKTTGLAARTVRAMRQANPTGVDIERRVGRDGRVRPLNATVGRQLAADYLVSHPDAPLRQIAAAVGISPGTARDVRARMRRGEDPVPSIPHAGDDAQRPRGVTQGSARAQNAQSADVKPMLATLSNDPALRMTDAGRELLRWLRLHAVNAVDSAKLVENVPAHCVDHLVQLASCCSANWAKIADDLARSSEQSTAAAESDDEDMMAPAEQCS